MKEIVVLVAHGTVEDLARMPEFLLEIRRGRPVPDRVLEEMIARYERVGGSPLLRETNAQAHAVEHLTGIETRVAMRLSDPRLEDVVADLGQDDRVILVPVAPFSVPVYEAAAREALARLAHPPRLVCVAPWGDQPDLIGAHVDAILGALGGRKPPDVHLILSAHSLPAVVIQRGDRYERHFQATVNAVSAGVGMPCSLAYQSQGADGGDWLGPDLEEVIDSLSTSPAEAIAIAPVGFLTEHVETLYDLDIEARALVEAQERQLIRVPALGSHPGLVSAIAAAVAQARSQS